MEKLDQRGCDVLIESLKRGITSISEGDSVAGIFISLSECESSECDEIHLGVGWAAPETLPAEVYWALMHGMLESANQRFLEHVNGQKAAQVVRAITDRVEAEQHKDTGKLN